jgi:tetratricopeptide (TPR) repeat protein
MKPESNTGSARKNYRVIKDAYSALNGGRYLEASIALERILASGQKDPYTLFLLAVSYLYTDQFAKADSVITKLVALAPDYDPLMHLQAFLGLKSAPDVTSALKIYLDLIYRNPADPFLQRGRKLIGQASDFRSFQKKARLSDFVNVPKPPRKLKKSSHSPVLKPVSVRIGRKRGRKVFAAAAVIGIFFLAAAAVFYYSRFHNSGRDREKTGSLSRIDMISINSGDYDLVKTINREKVQYFYYSGKDLSDDFDRAKRLIKSERYNEGVMILNRISNSNASFMVKEKCDFLIRFVTDLEDRTFESVPYNKISSRPYLYRGCALKIRGRIANLKLKNGRSMFSLLVDYVDKEAVSGTIDVYADRSAAIANGDLVDIEGVVTGIIGNSKSIYVVAKGIRKI